MDWMSREQLNSTLEEVRTYAKVVRAEWEDKNPAWIPHWVLCFEALDHFASMGVLPDSWNPEI